MLFREEFLKEKLILLTTSLIKQLERPRSVLISNNTEMLLKPGMYGAIELTIPIGRVLALPEAAVIDTGTKKIVFIEKAPGFYRLLKFNWALKEKATIRF